MVTAGIICEYNPFHLGHMYHIQETRRLTGAQCIVAIMSGDFVQRGEPAVQEIEQRAQQAIEGGADLVVQLPYVYACSGAELFAMGGCQIATMLSLDYLSFGSEIQQVEELKKLAGFLADEPEAYRDAVKGELDQGNSFARARQMAVSKFLGQSMANILSQPNCILGIEYIKALIRLERAGFDVPEPVAIGRVGAEHGTCHNSDYSATAARLQMSPEDKAVSGIDSFSIQIISAIRRMNPREISLYGDMEPGLENRIKTMAENSLSVSELVSKVANKRITEARVRRILCNILTGETSEMCRQAVAKGPYLRAVAMNEKGRAFLREYEGNVPVYTRIKDVDRFCHKNHNPMFRIEKMAEEQYRLVMMTKSR